jgi:hypothetical protein
MLWKPQAAADRLAWRPNLKQDASSWKPKRKLDFDPGLESGCKAPGCDGSLGLFFMAIAVLLRPASTRVERMLGSMAIVALIW